MGASLQLLDEPQGDTLIKDSVKRVKEQLAQIPPGSTKALVIAADWKAGQMMPTVRLGYANRMANGWEVHAEAAISKADKGASIRAVRVW